MTGAGLPPFWDHPDREYIPVLDLLIVKMSGLFIMF
jgi:hypothetical protein